MDLERFFIFLVCTCLFMGCTTERTPQSPKPKATPQLDTPASAVTATRTSTVTAAPTISPTSTKVVDESIHFQPLTTYSTLPDNIELSGRIVFIEPGLGSRFKIYLFDVATGDLKPLLPDGKIAYQVSVSPDHQWLAYMEGDGQPGPYFYDPNFDQPSFGTGKSLVVLDSGGTEHARMAFQEGWGGLSRWLTNTTLIIRRDNQERFSLLTAKYLLNPFTQEIVELPPNPEDIYIHPMDWNGMGLISYSSTLRYRAYSGGKFGMVLEDLQTKQKLIDMPVYDSPAEWSPDGQQFIYVGVKDFKQEHLEFFLVNIQGKVNQLTNLGLSNLELYPYGYSWSPDGRKVAFWFWKASDAVIQLATVDVVSGKIMGYSIESDVKAYHIPIWSLNSNQLLVGIYQSDRRDTVLVNFEKSLAVHLKEGMIPAGWLDPHFSELEP